MSMYPVSASIYPVSVFTCSVFGVVGGRIRVPGSRMVPRVCQHVPCMDRRVKKMKAKRGVPGSGFSVWELEFRVAGLQFGVRCGFVVWGSGYRGWGLGFEG